MEVVSLAIEDLRVEHRKTIGEVTIRHYKLPDVSARHYRLYYKDGSFEDVEADNASQAFQLRSRQDVEKIGNLRLTYATILEQQVIQPSGKQVKPSLQPPETEQKLVAAVLQEKHYPEFQALDFSALVEYYNQMK